MYGVCLKSLKPSLSHQFNSISNHTEIYHAKGDNSYHAKLPNDYIDVAWNFQCTPMFWQNQFPWLSPTVVFVFC